jgi:flagellar hook-associated protein 2
MGGISTGVGLISGINSSQLIEQLLGLEARGKTTLVTRVATLQGKRTSLLDVNSRLLALKSASTSFRINKVFRAATATSSDELVATATADNTTPIGSYQFFVNRLATTSQSRTAGFASFDASPLGLDSLSFEFGDVGVARTVDLESLNGGTGVRRGKIVITDKSGADATIDLSKTTTLGDVVGAINANTEIGVTASVDGERLVLSDTSGGVGSLIVSNGSGSYTATDLGIAGSTAGSSITSSQINVLGAKTTLASLNDGLGVFIRDGLTDFKIFVDDGVTPTTYNVSLGRENLPITGATELASLNNGSGVKINTTDAADFVVKTTNGTSVEINLGKVVDDNGNVDDQAVETVAQMLDRVNNTLAEELGSNKVVMTINADGDGFVLTDTIGGAETLRVLGAGPNSQKTATDLGIFTGTTGTGAVVTGSTIINEVKTARATTIQDVMDRIAAATDGAVTAQINAAGTGLRLVSGFEFSVLAGVVDGSSIGSTIAEKTARDLGLFDLTDSNPIGSRILSGMGTVLTRNINGGAGLTSATNSLTLTDRSGASVTVNNLNSYTTLESLIDAVNAAALAAPSPVDISLSVGGDNGSLLVTDSSGGSGNLIIAGTAATALGIANAGVASNTIRGQNLEIKYISEATAVGALNYGKGLGTGQLRLTDSTGAQATVDVGSDAVTLYDILQEINSRGLAIEARVNSTGDGITLFDTAASPTGKMKVEDLNGSVAKFLSVAGTATAAGDDITGSYEKTIDLDTTDTLKKVIAKINAKGYPITATSVNTGSGATPFYLTLSSSITGIDGKLLIDTGGIDLGFTTLSEGRDAEVIFGNDDPASGLVLRSADNVFEDLVSGLDVTVSKVSEGTVTIDVQRDVAGIKTKVTDWVAALNAVIDKINTYDSYDIDTKKRGSLLGDSTLGRTRTVLYNTLQGKAKNVDSAYQYLSQIGIRVGKEGQIEFNESKFDSAYNADPESVEKLFATLEQENVTEASGFEGVTIGSSKIVSTALGFGDLFDQALSKLTSTVDGAFTKASDSFQSQIDRANERITLFDAKLNVRRERLQAQFAAMEQALAQLSSQQSSIASITSLIG